MVRYRRYFRVDEEFVIGYLVKDQAVVAGEYGWRRAMSDVAPVLRGRDVGWTAWRDASLMVCTA